MSSKARIVVASVVFIGILFGAVYPTRTYFAQQRDLRAAEHRLELFRQQNGRLEAEAERLQSDEEIERIARARFNLVKPGEEAYAIVSVPPAPGQVPGPPPPARGPKKAQRPHGVLSWVVGTLQRLF